MQRTARMRHLGEALRNVGMLLNPIGDEEEALAPVQLVEALHRAVDESQPVPVYSTPPGQEVKLVHLLHVAEAVAGALRAEAQGRAPMFTMNVVAALGGAIVATGAVAAPVSRARH